MSQSGTWLMSTADGISNDDKITNFYVYGHDHAKWYFSRPGVYKLTFQSSATIGGEPVTKSDTFTFLVGSTVWKGINGSNWDDSGNWISGVPVAGSTVIFTKSTDPNQPLTQNIAAPLDLHGVIFTVNAGAYHLGGQTLRLSVDSPEIFSESSNNQEIGNPFELGAAATFAINGAGIINLLGEVSGSGSLTKTGPGMLVLANNARHTADTVIEKGILALNTAGQIENSAIVNNATFQVLSGTHTVHAITGTGIAEVLSGSLTVQSLIQDKLTIGDGAKVTIIPLSGGPLSDKITPVPEPSIWLMLGCALIMAIISMGSTRSARISYS